MNNVVLSAIALVLLIACNSSDDDWQREDEYDFDYNVSLASSAWMDVHIINATGSLNNRIFDGLDTYYSCISTEPKIVSSENNDDANVIQMDGRVIWGTDTIIFTFPSVTLDGRAYDVTFDQDITEYNIVYNGETIVNADVNIKGAIERVGAYSRSIRYPKYDCDIEISISDDTDRINLQITEVEF